MRYRPGKITPAKALSTGLVIEFKCPRCPWTHETRLIAMDEYLIVAVERQLADSTRAISGHLAAHEDAK